MLREFRIKDTAGIWYLRFRLDLSRPHGDWQHVRRGACVGPDGNMATSSASKIASVAPVASLKVAEPVGKKAKQSKTAAQQTRSPSAPLRCRTMGATSSADATTAPSSSGILGVTTGVPVRPGRA